MGPFETALKRLTESSPEEGLHLYSKATELWHRFQKVLTSSNKVSDSYIWDRFGSPLVTAMSHVCYWVLQHKEVSPGVAKQVELATRAFLKIRNRPKDVRKWGDLIVPVVDYLLDSVLWRLRSEGEQKAFVGKLALHDTVNVTKAEFDKYRALVTSASSAMQSSRIPRIASILYGDVIVVGQVLRSNTLAFYNVNDDVIFLRHNAPKTQQGPIHSLVHEFGHRFYRKVLPTNQKMFWAGWHQEVSSHNDANSRYPEVGEKLPFKLTPRATEYPEVLRVVRDGFKVKFYVSDRAFVTGSQIRKYYSDLAYPTLYAAESPEEHFCEAFALLCLGQLTEPHLSKFLEIVS